jgi:hypothetical protein
MAENSAENSGSKGPQPQFEIPKVQETGQEKQTEQAIENVKFLKVRLQRQRLNFQSNNRQDRLLRLLKYRRFLFKPKAPVRQFHPAFKRRTLIL